MLLSFLGRPTRPLFLLFLTYSSADGEFRAGTAEGISSFSFLCSPSDSPSEKESAEFPDITAKESRGEVRTSTD